MQMGTIIDVREAGEQVLRCPSSGLDLIGRHNDSQTVVSAAVALRSRLLDESRKDVPQRREVAGLKNVDQQPVAD